MNSKYIAPIAVASAVAIGGSGYALGNYFGSNDTPSYTSSVSVSVEDAKYIGNANSMKFHHSWCDSVDKMNEYNKVPFETSSEARQKGYKPCKRCEP